METEIERKKDFFYRR